MESGFAEGHPPGDGTGFGAADGGELLGVGFVVVPLAEESASGFTVFTDDPESSLTAGLRRCVWPESGVLVSFPAVESDSAGAWVRVTEVVPCVSREVLAIM